MIDYYGSYLCIQDKFKINISDDFPHLSSHTEFFENNNKYFTFSYSSCLIKNTGTNKNKTELNIEDNPTENNLDLNFDEEPSIPHIVKQNIPLEKNIEYSDNNDFDIDALIDNENNTELNLEAKSLSESESKNSTESTNNMKDTNSEESTIYETDYSDDDSNDNDEDEESSNSDSDSETNYSSNMDDSSMEDDDLQMFAYINNFPVQMICLEKCKNTADSLFTSDAMTSDIGISFLTQVTFTLLILQKAFHFTHNDLHTNNIMYIETELEFIYYKYNSTIYKVPTYGYLFKIIDFGRAIYKYDETVYCSDSYSKGEDAHTLYNFKPFYNKNIPILEPNYSFDLCRLGISIYDMIMESVENVNKLDDFQSWVYRLCLDDDNKSIIYKRNGDARYSGFKMYKMIAKTVHNHSPVSQLAYSTIKQFITKEIPSNITHLVNIDKIPVYA